MKMKNSTTFASLAHRLAVRPTLWRVNSATVIPWGKRPSDAAEHSNIYAYYKLTVHDFLTRDHLAISRLTITYERKDDGKRVTLVAWVSNDLRYCGAGGKLRDLLARMRPAIQKERAAAAKLYSMQIL